MIIEYNIFLYSATKKQKKFDFSVYQIKFDIHYTCSKEIVIQRKEKNDLAKKKKSQKKLSTKEVISLIIEAVIALATLITAIKS